jgi:hypothetical protein
VVVGARLVPGLGGPPLYDGVVPVGPYLWLEPGPGRQGGAQGAKATVAVDGGQNGLVALATTESLPQAQVLATPGALILAQGATSLAVSIEPVPPPGEPTDGQLASNVYRFTIKDQNGADATAKLAAKVSIVLRSADAALANGVVERWDGTAWVPLKTAPPGFNGTYLAIVTEFGDYAVVKPGPPASPGPSAGAPTAAGSGAASSSAGASAVASAEATSSTLPAVTAAPGDTGSSPSGIVGPLLGAALIAGIVFVVLVVLSRLRTPRPPTRGDSGRRGGTYRGAHKLDGR